MLPVEAEIRLCVRVCAEEVEVNDVAAWAFGAKNTWAEAAVAHVLWQMQEQRLEEVLAGEQEVACTGCGVIRTGERAVLRRGSRPRKVRTSNGPVRFRLRQVTCPDCRKTWSPFAELLGLRPRQRILEEFTRRLVDWVTELSYAKTCRLGREWLGDAPAPKTLHAKVQERGEALEFTRTEPVMTVVGDGTKVPAGGKPRGEDLTVAFQLRGGRYSVNGRPAVRKRVVGLGIGPGSWPAALSSAGEPELVVTDAETGVRELVGDLVPDARHQLCEWHVPYSLAHTLGLEGMAVEERKALAGKLSGILTRRDPKIFTFADRLDGYPKAQAFFRRAEPFILYSPPSPERTTSIVEREMREINRRSDVGARWSIRGLRNLASLRLAKRHNPDDYERLWTSPRPCHSTLVPQA